MADKEKQETNKNAAPQFYSIEELQKKKKTHCSTFGGICAALEWKPGKMVTEEEYDAAVEKFSCTPIGRKVK